jgi:PTS system mannose-specific IIC component
MMDEINLVNWLWCIFLGAMTGVDAVSWPQAMISRPLVAATLGGAALGDPAAGLLVGAVLEVVAMRHVPLGVARRPDSGPAGIVAGATGAVAAGPMGLGVAAVVGWGVGWMGARTVDWLRWVNTRLVSGPSAAKLAVRPVRLERRHRLAMGLDGVRGAVVVGSLLVPAVALARIVPGPEGSLAELALVTGLVGAVATGAGAAGGTLSSDRWGGILVALGAGGMLALQTIL